MPESSAQSNAFDTFTATRLSSLILERVWQAAYGVDYAAEARPNAFYSQSVLNNIVNAVSDIAVGGRLLDVGCGHGLGGLYLARMLQAKHHCGVDASPGSIALAQQQQEANVAVINGKLDASFRVADAASTGLEDGSCAVVVCLDVLLYLPDKLAAIQGMFRVLKSGGYLAFTTWEQEGGHNARLDSQQVTDYRPLLAEAGFVVEAYSEVAGWREMQQGVLDGIIDARGALGAELGGEVAKLWVAMARAAQSEMGGRRYVLGIARRS